MSKATPEPVPQPALGKRSPETDADLVRRVQQGDVAAYRFLVERYQQRLFAVAYGMLHNREDAREIAQETFIKAFGSLDRFRFDSSFYTWMYRIAVNLTIDHRRRNWRRVHTEFDEGRLQGESVMETMPDPQHASPGQRLDRKRLMERIEWAIAQLPEDQRDAIVLREIDGLSYKEISEVLDCPEGTVMSRLFYGRKKLQTLLADQRG